MKIVQVDELPILSKTDPATGKHPTRAGPGHSGAVIFDSEILDRDGKRLDNFHFGISVHKEGDFSTPRHRHTFQQFRYIVEGKADISPTRQATDGMLTFFPETAYYGPQDVMLGTSLVLQFGGPSGLGYSDRRVNKAARDEMVKLNTGVFRDGKYYRNPGVEGPPVQDANEAMFEFIRGRPMVYPKAQYAEPIVIDPPAFPWMPVEGSPGLAEKALGTFTSAKTSAAQYQLDPGAKFTAKEKGVYYVLSGKGALAGGPYRKQTALHLEEGESATYVASEKSLVLYLGLTRESAIQDPTPIETKAVEVAPPDEVYANA